MIHSSLPLFSMEGTIKECFIMYSLILLVVLPLLQFCSKAFGDYAAQSEVIDILLNSGLFFPSLCTYLWSSN